MAISGGGLITVVVVDDHRIIREGVRGVLEPQPDMQLVGEGWVGDHVEKLVREHRPKVLLLDLRMKQSEQPGSDRNSFKVLPTIKHILQIAPDLNIIILTAHLSLAQVEGAFEKGARGYLLKDDMESLSLPNAIRSVCAGRLLFSAKVKKVINTDGGRLTNDSPLTRRQQEIILTVSTNLDLPYSLHAETLEITEASLRNHLSNIFRELQVTNLASCIVRCMRLGILPRDLEELH